MITIRTVRPDDVGAIANLVKDAGFPNRSEAGWHWAIFENPEQGDLPPGLVAERNGRLASFIGLQARRFMADRETLTVISGHTFMSGPDGRGAGFALARRALQSHGGAAIYTLNNNAVAGDFHKRIGLEAWLGRDGRSSLEWPIHSMTLLDGRALTRAARSEPAYDWLSKREIFRHVPGTLSPYLPGDGEVMSIDPSRPADARLIEDFGAATTYGRGAMPVRSAETYAYQMSDPDARGRIALLALGGVLGLDGLMQVAITKPNAFQPAELQIIDLVMRPGVDPAIGVPKLVRAAHEIARKARLSRLILPYAARFEPVCFDGTGLRYERHADYDCAHALFTPEAQSLQQAWSPTGFEGDLFFALRVTPPSARAKVRPAAQEKLHRPAWKYQAPEA